MNLKELAKHLQLSQTTVSRALNGYPEVNEETRKRVQAAAQRLNYSPNARAKGLATGRSMAIGHVIPVSSRFEIVNPVFGDFIAGTGEAYTREGYDLMLSVVNDGDEERVYRKIKARGTVDGMIVHGPRMKDPRITLLRELDLPFVVHGRSSEIAGDYAWLDVNNKSAFLRATTYLTDLGHRRIALINGLEHMDFAYRRRRGYEEGLQAVGLSADPALMRSTEMTEIHGYQGAIHMMGLDSPPTAFLVSSLVMAIGVRRALSDIGLTLGRDVSLITHDDDLGYLKNGSDVPIFTATRSSVREAGRLCGQMLLDIIHGRDGPRQTLLEADLIIGRSTGPAPTAG